MAILHNDQRLKPFLSQFKISSFSVFVQHPSRLCVCFEADVIVMEETGHLLRYLQSNCTLPTTVIFIPYHTRLYFTTLCYPLLSYTILCYTILYTTKLYYTRTIYYTILVLYYIILILYSSLLPAVETARV